MSEQVKVERIGHVAEVEFDHPPHNHATVGLLKALADTLEALDADASCRAVVLASAGKSFCAGADFVSESGFGGRGADPLREFYDQALRLYGTAKPIVAAVQGAAIGAGLGLAVAADFRVAAPEARFSANFVKLGYHPGFGLTVALPRLIGAQRAAAMFLTGARYKTEEVLPWGLVDAVAPLPELRAAARAFAGEIAENAPLSLLAIRKTMRAGLHDAVRAALVHEHSVQTGLQKTEDHAEGVRAVAERRAGNFTGR